MKKYDKKLTRKRIFLDANANSLESTCFFYDEVDIDKRIKHNGTLHMASRTELPCHIKTAATQHYDEKWLAMLSQNMLWSKGKTILSI